MKVLWYFTTAVLRWGRKKKKKHPLARNITRQVLVTLFKPLKTEVPFWGQNIEIVSSFSQQRDESRKRDKWPSTAAVDTTAVGRTARRFPGGRVPTVLLNGFPNLLGRLVEYGIHTSFRFIEAPPPGGEIEIRFGSLRSPDSSRRVGWPLAGCTSGPAD